MALQTKCSEFTGKKVVSQDEIFFVEKWDEERKY